MKTFKIVGVPEHFNFPFRLLAQFQPFEKNGISIEWKEESRGSGQMAINLKNGEAHMGILLTESFMKEFDNGSPVKMLGFHVKSPLVWGIHVNTSNLSSHVAEIQNRHFLVSRMGSGSHLMALVLADSMGWEKESLTFEIIGNMNGAKKAFETGNPGIFLWEKYTTSPEVKKNRMKRIGEINSPWPCFVMVVSEKAMLEFPELIYQIREEIYHLSGQLIDQEDLPQTLAKEYELDLDDIKSWLKQTQWVTDAKISTKDLNQDILKMMGYGIIEKKLRPEDFLLTN
jgi:hypothetical protein